jgi:dephospho-CoA kinase
VTEETRRALSELARCPDPPTVVIVEVPLLAEAPQFASMADLVIAITSDQAVRVDRAVSRGMDRADVLRRVGVQAPDSARAALADVVIENNVTLDEFLGKLERLWEDRFGDGGSRG